MWRGPFSSSRRRDLAAEIGGERTAPGEGAALDALLEARHLPGNLGEAPRRAGRARSRAWAPRRASLAYRDDAGSGRARPTGASSTLRPAYITMTRSAISATTPRSWVIRMTAAPTRRLRSSISSQDLRLDGDVERRGRLVGDQQLGVAGQRHRDHHALAHAAGELVRIFVAARRAGSGMPTMPASRRRVPRRPACRVPVHPQRLGDLPADGQHRIEARHRLLEDHRDVVAADLAHLALGELQQILALEADPRRRCLPGGSGISRRIDIEVTDLPQPDSPTMASVSPASTGRRRRRPRA